MKNTKKVIKRNKINLLFLINDLFINNFETIYYECLKNEDFSVTVVATDSLETEYKDYISSEEIKNYISKSGIKCINSFNKKTKQYIDLAEYNPDYIFVSNPYDIYRPSQYSSFNLSLIAKVCDIEYGAIIVKDDENFILNNTYYYNCYRHFIFDKKEKSLSKEFMKNKEINSKFYPIGCLKMDKYYTDYKKNKYWNKLFPTNNNLKIVYKPRWTIKNEKVFFEFFLKILNFTKNNNLQLFILEHPLLKSELKYKGLLEKYENMIQEFLSANIKVYNNGDFLDYVVDSDVLIAEPTSLIAEFSLTHKNIIMIGNYNSLNDFGKSIIKKNYCANSWEKIEMILKNILDKNKNNNKADINFIKENNITKKILNYIQEDYYYDNLNKKYYKEKIKKMTNELNNIKTILKQGYHEHGIISSSQSLYKEIDELLKLWADETTRLKIFEEMHRKE